MQSAVHRSQVPAAMDKNLEQLCFRKDGKMFLAASSLNTRYWKGSLWFYSNPESAPDPGLSTVGVDIDSSITDLALTSEDTVLLSTDSGSLEVWQLQEDDLQFEQITVSQVHDTIVSGISVNGRRDNAVSCDYGGCVKQWDLSTLQPLYQYRAHTDIVWSVCYHPQESTVFTSCSQDGKTLLWDNRKKYPAQVLASQQKSRPTCTAWQSNGNHLAIGAEDGGIEVKDLRNPDATSLHAKPHQRVVHRMAFCPGRDNTLASVSEDCSVVICHLSGSHCKEEYSFILSDFVRGLAWRDSSHLYTCSWDKQVKCHTYPNSDPSMDLEVNTNRSPLYADKLKKSANVIASACT